MRELKLRYFIDLASNIGPRARADAQAVEQAQKSMQSAVAGTNAKLRDYSGATTTATRHTERLRDSATTAATRVTALDRAMSRWGTNTSAERQLGFMRRLVSTIDQAEAKAARLTRTLASGIDKLQKGFMAGSAGGYVLAAALKSPVDYDTRLRAVTATAFAGKDVNALRSGRGEINNLVIDTIRQARGATRDSALGAFEKLVGTGSFTYDESKALLPSVMRTSVAARADPDDLVQAAEKMKVSLGLDPGQIAIALAKVMRGGQEGGFEIKDSAKWIGPLLPYLKGYKGMDGVEQLVTMLQQVRSTAGTNDEAANNLRNFLQKMGADSTRKDFKKQGFDLDAEMAKGVLARQTPVETYMNLLDRVMAKNDPDGKARAAMRKADKAATPEQRTEQYEAIKKIYQDSAVSKIINDLQEFGGYEGLRRTKEYGAKVLSAVRDENGNAISTGFQFMTEGTGARMQAAANEKDIAATNALEAMSGPLNKLIDGTVSLAERFPSLATAAYGATVALGALSAMSLLSGIAKGGLGAAASGLAGGAAGAAASGGASAATAAAARASTILSVSTAAGAGAATAGTMGLVAGGTMGGLALVGAPILGAGVLLNERANSSAGLTSRIADRDARIAETSQLIDLERTNGAGGAVARLEAQLRTMQRDREALAAKLNSLGTPGLDALTISAPGATAETISAGKTTEVKVGEGRIALDVRVTDDRVTARPAVTQQPSLVRIDAGNTNPGGGN
ncbi:hypothetical protein J2W28_002049 [Variovorax boronicumulans]|uniref:phage tail tape measure protein n=1 Tax=Variovorax boronicumulans TaxID=436515 RepID=UPI0027809F45|nr:phage tail tape measure protein [Variovorax boronicumulans]MDP9990879.1 hypothetical protein [Variovorax boronicumulans]MDQ0002907.1 hypothetical protein [Variovorax boronicumulans]